MAERMTRWQMGCTWERIFEIWLDVLDGHTFIISEASKMAWQKTEVEEKKNVELKMTFF